MLSRAELAGAAHASGALQQVLAARSVPMSADDAARTLRSLIDAQFDRLPPPGGGKTLERWRVLSEVAGHDLSVAKLFESHADALAILYELNDLKPVPAGSAWAVWAAEPPDAKVIVAEVDGNGNDNDSSRRVTLTGRKAWCSGARHLSHALITVWGADGRGPWLARVDLGQAGVRVAAEGWDAVGMAATASVDVHFHGAAATLVGDVGAYLLRPGFWHGGAGVAACWYGGARRLALALRELMRLPARAGANDFRYAALGKVDLALQQTAAILRAAAAQIDAHPVADAQALALRARMAAEACAEQVLHEVGRALGPAPFCKDPGFACMAADLPVFVRQSGGERDARALGEHRATSAADAWCL